jgi:nucleoside-diphosphate-sugar epimerase
MKLTIFAATGGIGRQLLEQAIAAGHDVTAVARNPRNLSAVPARAVAADLASADPAALQPAVAGADAVLSALGARTKADAGVAARGTQVITQAMRAAGVRRIIVVSAAPIGTIPSPGRPHPPSHDPGDGFIIRYLADPIVKRALREHYADLARMEGVLRDSDLDWTIMRPPRLTSKPVTGRYRTATGEPPSRVFVSRADRPLHAQHPGSAGTFRRTVGIANTGAEICQASAGSAW